MCKIKTKEIEKYYFYKNFQTVISSLFLLFWFNYIIFKSIEKTLIIYYELRDIFCKIYYSKKIEDINGICENCKFYFINNKGILLNF